MTFAWCGSSALFDALTCLKPQSLHVTSVSPDPALGLGVDIKDMQVWEPPIILAMEEILQPAMKQNNLPLTF